jgi:hypothetical protein
MSLTDEIQKLMDYVVDCTREFVTKHNGGVMPPAEEIMQHGESHEFPELQVGDVSSSFFVWRKQHVLVFHTHWAKDGTTIKSEELPQDRWPLPLKLKLAHSIEVRAPDGSITKIL